MRGGAARCAAAARCGAASWLAGCAMRGGEAAGRSDARRRGGRPDARRRGRAGDDVERRQPTAGGSSGRGWCPVADGASRSWSVERSWVVVCGVDRGLAWLGFEWSLAYLLGQSSEWLGRWALMHFCWAVSLCFEIFGLFGK